MSTTPGDSTWADAGLVPPEHSQVQDPARSTVPVDPASQPRAPMPVLRDEAPDDVNDADALEQRRGLRTDTGDADAAGADGPSVPADAAEGDALEQAQDLDDAGFAGGTTSLPDDASEGDALDQALAVPDDGTDDYPAV